MAYDNDKPKISPYIPKEYLTYELQKFDEEMKIYLEEKTLTNGTIVHVYNTQKYLQDNKAINHEGAVILKVNEFNDDGTIKSYIYPPAYQVLSEKLEQWNKWKARKEYAQNKQVEGLDDLADQMKI